jgi:dTDP-4-amino-4,6-dideoxygalactose transaminase
MVAQLTPVLVPDMPTTDDLLGYLNRIDISKVYSNGGPLNAELVARLADYFKVDADCICLVSNATVGLIGSLECSDQVSEYIEVPSFTFTATPASVVAAGLKLLLVDIDSNFRMMPTGDNRSVIDVLPFGNTLRQESWYDSFAFNLIDAAASFDALKGFGEHFHPKSMYSIVVSLHATKLLGAGEGGIVISNNPGFIRRIKEWSNFGFSSLGSVRESRFAGTNSKLSEYSCAVALASLDRWSQVRDRYLKNVDLVHHVLKDSPFASYETTLEGFATPYWIVRHDSDECMRDLEKTAKSQSMETRKWWGVGCHRMPAYSHIPHTSLTETEKQSERYLGMPFHNFLTPEDWKKMQNIFVERAQNE